MEVKKQQLEIDMENGLMQYSFVVSNFLQEISSLSQPISGSYSIYDIFTPTLEIMIFPNLRLIVQSLSQS